MAASSAAGEASPVQGKELPDCRPNDHPGTAPQLSRLPMLDAELRAEFVSALTSHLAQFGTAAGPGGTQAASSVACRIFTASRRNDGGVGSAGLTADRVVLPASPPPSHSRAGELLLASDLSSVSDEARSFSEGNWQSQRAGQETVLGSDEDSASNQALMNVAGLHFAAGIAGRNQDSRATTATSTVGGSPARVGSELDEEGTPARAGKARETACVHGDDGGFEERERSLTGEGNVGEVGRAGGGNMLFRDSSWKEECHEYLCGNEKEREVAGADPEKNTLQKEPAKDSSVAVDCGAGTDVGDYSWAQEYHEYLCNREREREAAAAADAET